MDQNQQLVALTIAAAVGILATIGILRRQRHDREPPVESQYATSTEGERRIDVRTLLLADGVFAPTC